MNHIDLTGIGRLVGLLVGVRWVSR